MVYTVYIAREDGKSYRARQSNKINLSATR